MRAAGGPAIAALALGALVVCLQAPPGRAAEEKRLFLEGECSLCHGEEAVFAAGSERLRAFLDDLAAEDPSWYRGVLLPHLMEVLPGMVEGRAAGASVEAWKALVHQGRALFEQPGLGKPGRACADCHDEESLRRVGRGYPKAAAPGGGAVSLEERIAGMIVGKLGGAAPAGDDARIAALATYLRSLD